MIALSTIVGFLFWIGVGGVVFACITGLLGRVVNGRRIARPLSKRQERKVDAAADRALRELEQKVGE